MASRRSSDDEFLRYHWIIYTNEYKEPDIHRSLKTKIRLKDDKRDRITLVNETNRGHSALDPAVDPDILRW